MVLSECKMEKQNCQLEHGQPMEQTRGLFCMCDLSVLVNEFDVQSVFA